MKGVHSKIMKEYTRELLKCVKENYVNIIFQKFKCKEVPKVVDY